MRVRAVKMQKIGCAPDWALLPPAPCAVQIAETEFEGLRAFCMENEKLRAAQGQVDQSTAASGTISAALREAIVAETIKSIKEGDKHENA